LLTAEDLAVLFVFFTVAHPVEAIHLGIARIGDLVAHKKPLIEAHQPVDLVVGVGLVLTGIVALLLEEAVVVEIVVVTEIVVWRLFKLQR